MAEHLRIESDGSTGGTRVVVVGTDKALAGVTKIEWSLVAGGHAHAILTLLDVPLIYRGPIGRWQQVPWWRRWLRELVIAYCIGE